MSSHIYNLFDCDAFFFAFFYLLSFDECKFPNKMLGFNEHFRKMEVVSLSPRRLD